MSVHSLPPMKNPPHPGALVREDVINELGLTIAGAAELLDVSHPNLRCFSTSESTSRPRRPSSWRRLSGWSRRCCSPCRRIATWRGSASSR